MADKRVLENLLKEFGYWQNHGQILKENPWSSEQRYEISQRIYHNDTHFSGTRGTPDYLDAFINEHIKDSKTDALNYTKDNLDDILDETDAKNLIPGVFAITKDYQDMLQTYSQKDTAKMNAYLEKELFENKVGLVRAFRYHTAANKDIITISYAQEINKKQIKIISEVSDSIEENGKIEMNPSKYKITDYISENLPNANDAMKENFYFAVASQYASED